MDSNFLAVLLKIANLDIFMPFIVLLLILILAVKDKIERNKYKNNFYVSKNNESLSTSQKIDNFIEDYSKNKHNFNNINKVFKKTIKYNYTKTANNDYLVNIIIILTITSSIYLTLFVPSTNTNKKIIQKENSFANNYDKCINHYNARAYGAFKTCSENLKAKYPNSTDARYLNGISALKAGNADGAIEDFKFVIENEKNIEMQNDAKKRLQKAKEMKRLKRHDIGHYFAELDEIILWENPRNLKVYISNDFEKGEILKKAFIKWDEALYNLINFTFVNDPNNAQIYATATKREEVKKTCITLDTAVGCASHKYYFYNDKPNKKYFKKVNIQVAVNYDDEYLIDENTFLGIALHEIGHALGIISHSPSIGDAMYKSTETYAAGKVTNRDANTVRRIYGNIL